MLSKEYHRVRLSASAASTRVTGSSLIIPLLTTCCCHGNVPLKESQANSSLYANERATKTQGADLQIGGPPLWTQSVLELNTGTIMYLGFLLKHNSSFEYVQQAAEEEGLEEAPGILENMCVCVCLVFDGSLMDELSGNVNLTAHASAIKSSICIYLACDKVEKEKNKDV